VRVFFDVRRFEGVTSAVDSGLAELGFALGMSEHPNLASETVIDSEMVCVMPPGHVLATKAAVTPSDLSPYPFIGLERGTRLGEAVRASFREAGCPFNFTVEVRYCNSACVLAAAGVGLAVVDPFSPASSGPHDLVTRPFRPKTKAVASVAWSKARPLSRLAMAFLGEVRAAAKEF
jgi:DNA-binding transcriptional LysR family regulator